MAIDVGQTSRHHIGPPQRTVNHALPPPPLPDGSPDWVGHESVADPEAVAQSLAALRWTGADAVDVDRLIERIGPAVLSTERPDETVERLTRVFAAGDAAAMVRTAADDDGAVTRLVRMLDVGPALASRIIADPVSASAVMRGGGVDRRAARAKLERDAIDDETVSHLGRRLRRFHARHLVSAAAEQVVDRATPARVAASIAWAVETAVDVAVAEMSRRLNERRGTPTHADGTPATVAVVAVGRAAAGEYSYDTPVRALALFDRIDHRNRRHREYFETLIGEVVDMLGGDRSRPGGGIDLDLRPGPRFETGTPVCGFFDAVRIFETSGRLDQRRMLAACRAIAGSRRLADRFVDRMTPWVYRRYPSRDDLDELAIVARRPDRVRGPATGGGSTVAAGGVDAGGGMDAIRRAVGVLKLVHGGEVPAVRLASTIRSLDALSAAGCVAPDVGGALQQNYVRLWRLEQEAWVTASRRSGHGDRGDATRMATRLGLTGDDGRGQPSRLEESLARVLIRNGELIDRALSVATSARGGSDEAALVLDPDFDPDRAADVLARHGLTDVDAARRNLSALSTEPVRFLSSHRCKYRFSKVAAAVLSEIARTPRPDRTLANLAAVTDSLGGKAGLWELVDGNRATLRLLVRLCAAASYLVRILIENPGMIDELVDSLLFDRLPGAGRLDGHSRELVRGAADVDLVLRGFKNSSQLIIGVRDLLGSDPLPQTHAALTDVGGAVLARAIETQYAVLTDVFGDPVDARGTPVQHAVIVWGKYGSREPNYHSDLSFTVLYSADGQTRRRVGGRRMTASNADLFETLAAETLRRLTDDAGGRGPLIDAALWCPPPAGRSDAAGVVGPDRAGADESSVGGPAAGGPVPVRAMTFDSFFERLADADADVRLRLTRGRTIVGGREIRRALDEKLRSAAAGGGPPPPLPPAGDDDNLKRGRGGTVSVEWIGETAAAGRVPEGPTTTDTESLLRHAAAIGLITSSDVDPLRDGYRYLRRVESYLRLMELPERHRWPSNDADRADVAFLMGADSGDEVHRRIEAHRRTVTAVVDRVSADDAS